MASNKKLNKSGVDSIPLVASGQQIYFDTELAGFGLRVGAKSKTYFAEKRVNGRTVRVTIGKHGVFTAEEARKKAREFLILMACDVNPNELAAERAAKNITLQAVFDEYLAKRALKPLTVKDYKRAMAESFSDWMNRPIVSITKDMVATRHAQFGAVSQARANLAMRVLRSLMNFAAARYEDSKGVSLVPENPVKRLSQTRSWFRVERRRTWIKPTELKPWFDAVMTLESGSVLHRAETVRDYLLLLLFTGLRRQEAATLRWSSVDFASRTLTIEDTKNHEPHTLPLSDFLIELLNRRKDGNDSPYVFPGSGAGGYVVEPRKQMDKVIAQSGVDFTPHDLRRTFITIAESLDISAYALKRLLNHKMRHDVTAGYIVADVERLREPMQKITDFILSAAGARPKAEVIALPIRHSSRKQ